MKELKDMTNTEKGSLLMLNCRKIKNSFEKLWLLLYDFVNINKIMSVLECVKFNLKMMFYEVFLKNRVNFHAREDL